MRSLFNSRLLGYNNRTDSGKLNSTSYRDVPAKRTNLPVVGIDDFDPQYKPRTEKITYNRALTNATFTEEIAYLENIEKQDVLSWKDDFIRIRDTCGWTEEIAKDYLIALCSLSIRKLFQPTDTLTNMLVRIVQKKFPPVMMSRFSRKLVGLRQNQFHDITDYLEAIDDVVFRWGAAANATPPAMEAKKEATFLQGLAPETLDFMDLHGICGIGNIFQRIKSTEANLSERAKENERKESIYKEHKLLRDSYGKKEPKENSDKSYRNSSRKSRRSDRNYNKPNASKNSDAYCSIHHTDSHTDSQCRAQMGDYEHKKNNYNRNNYSKAKDSYSKDQYGRKDLNGRSPHNHIAALQEPKAEPRAIEISVFSKDKQLTALVDTGSCFTYASDLAVKKMGLTKQSTPSKKDAILADGSTVSTSDYVDAKLSLSKDHTDSLDTRCYILKNCQPELILGMDFLIHNDFTLNVKDNLFSLNGTYFPANQDNGRKLSNCDQELATRFRICTATTNSDKCDQTIKEFKLKNPLLGKISGSEHSIPVKDKSPFIEREYPIPLGKYEETMNEIKRLSQLGIIRASTLNYVSPAFPIYKANGNIRIVVNYRKLNERTIPLTYPLPTLPELLGQLQGANVFSQIDLSSGFYQIPMEPESIKYTAFILNHRIWEFTRMPFGLTNAPFSFQKAMFTHFGHLDFMKIYMDDLLIHSKDEETHKKHLIEFFETAAKISCQINFNKTKFFQTTVKYLGHEITPEGIRADPSKATKIIQSSPKNKKQIMKILGVIQWFRPFLPNLSVTSAFLSDKLRENEKFAWDTEDDDKLQVIYNKIQERTLLSHPNPKQEFRMEADASIVGGGAVVMQHGKLIGYYSHKWSTSEINYTITEKELLIIVKAFEHFKTILFSAETRVYTDNANVIFQQDLTSRSQRWRIRLENFNYSLHKIDGKQNTGADFLSRLNSVGEGSPNHHEDDDFKLNLEEIQREQNACPFTKGLINKGKTKEITINNVKLIFTEDERLIIPERLQERILIDTHYYLLHPGKNSMTDNIRRYWFIKRLGEKVQTLTANCYECQVNKTFRRNYGLLTGHVTADRPYEFISTDIYGPLKTEHFPEEEEGIIGQAQFYILTVSDIFSRWSEVTILLDIRASTVTNKLKECWLDKFPKPLRLLSDRGTQYTSKILENLCAKEGIRHTFTSPYNPQCNGFSERINQSIGVTLRTNTNVPITKLPALIKRKLNYNINRTIGVSPQELLDKFSILDPLQRDLTEEVRLGLERRKKEQEKEEIRRNKNRKEHEFKVGDSVYVKTHSQDKLDEKWIGPGEIIKASNHGQLTIIIEGKKIEQNIRNVRPVPEGAGCRGLFPEDILESEFEKLSNSDESI